MMTKTESKVLPQNHHALELQSVMNIGKEEKGGFSAEALLQFRKCSNDSCNQRESKMHQFKRCGR